VKWSEGCSEMEWRCSEVECRL